MGQWDNKMTKIEQKTPIRQDRQVKCTPNAPNQAYHYAREGIVPLSRSAKKPESEKTLEAKLRKAVESRGGMALKLLSQLHRGLPDRLILMPCGLTYFAEIKTTGKKPTKLQLRCHRQLRELTFPVFIIDSTASLEEALAAIDSEVHVAKLVER